MDEFNNSVVIYKKNSKLQKVKYRVVPLVMFETCKRILFMDTVVGVKSTTAYVRMINTEFRVLGCCCTTPGSLIHIVCQRIVFQGEAIIDWKGGRSIQGASVVPIMYNFLKIINKKK